MKTVILKQDISLTGVIFSIAAFVFGCINIFTGMDAIFNHFGDSWDVYNGTIVEYNSGTIFFVTLGIFLFLATTSYFLLFERSKK